MKRLLTTTAIVLAMGTSAHAQTAITSTTILLDYQVEMGSDLFASDLLGMRVYASENEFNAMSTVAVGGEAEWDDIGEINDLIVTESGEIAAVILGVGGFLGMGEKDVALDLSQINRVREQDDPDKFFLVVNASQEVLEAAPAFNRGDDDMAMTSETTTSEVMIEDIDRPMFVAPQIERDGYAMVDRAELTSETLTGARVYDISDEDVGEVSTLLLSDDGMVDQVILDIGGFLGLGEHQVAVTFDELGILRSDDGDDFRVYIDATQESLEAQPEYKG